MYLGKSKSIKNCKKVSDKIRESGLIGFGWRVRKAEPTEIGRESCEARTGEGSHLVAPRVPYLREPVQEYDDVWTLNAHQPITTKMKSGAFGWELRSSDDEEGDIWGCSAEENGWWIVGCFVSYLPVPMWATWSLRLPTLMNLCWISSITLSMCVYARGSVGRKK